MIASGGLRKNVAGHFWWNGGLKVLLSDTKLPKDITQYLVIGDLAGDAAQVVDGVA